MPDALAKHSQGESFCARDFVEVTSAVNAKNLLARYASEGLLERLLPGVYCLTPEGAEAFDAGYGTHVVAKGGEGEAPGGSTDGTDPKTIVVYPSTEDVAHTLARLRGWIIAPAGEFALSTLGIVPVKANELTYASTGSTLSYDYLGTKIAFVHASTRELVGLSETTKLVAQSLRAARKVHAGEDAPREAKAIPTVEDVTRSIARTFSGHQIEELQDEASQLPQWMQSEIRRISKLREEASRASQLRPAFANGHYGIDPSLLDSATSAYRDVLSRPLSQKRVTNHEA